MRRERERERIKDYDRRTARFESSYTRQVYNTTTYLHIFINDPAIHEKREIRESIRDNFKIQKILIRIRLAIFFYITFDIPLFFLLRKKRNYYIYRIRNYEDYKFDFAIKKKKEFR